MSVRESVLRVVRSPQAIVKIVAGVLACVIAYVALKTVFGPFLESSSTYGIHDWDTHTAHRYIPMLELKRYHEGPWWSPWFCGGYASWGYSESGASLVSPFFPFYWFASMPVALRAEIIGTTLIGAVGTFLLAKRHTPSTALSLLVVAVFVWNGRWALQTTSGHAWHLQYAYLPWALWFFERAIEKQWKNVIGGAIAIALLVYVGGIYPLPHAALALVIYAIARAVTDRSLRPLWIAAAQGALAVGFAAPKLLPVIDTMRRAPRVIDSVESMELRQALIMLTDHEQGFGRMPYQVGALPYGWHEFGIYIGWAGALVIGLGLVLRGRGKGNALRVVGAIFLILSFGAFHQYAPWTLLHQLPVFKSQHVPSRFMHPAILFLALAFVSSVGARFERLFRRRPWLDLLLLAPVAWIALDIATVSREIVKEAMTQEMPAVTEAATFHHETYSPVNYARPDWATPVYLATRANVGAMECWAVPNDFPRGAIVQGAPNYEGEAHVANGTGSAVIKSWTPNSAVVEVKDATPGSVLVYNMNWDPSWRAEGRPAMEYQHAVAAPLAGGTQTITFRYRPRTLPAGLFLLLASVLALFAPGVFKRKPTEKAPEETKAEETKDDAEATRTPLAQPPEPPAPPPDPT